jgi:hypothetical protein
MAKVQQLITLDELTAGNVEQGWLEAVVQERGIVPERLPAEITSERTADGDTSVTTLWSQNRPIAIAIRQRDEMNYTVLTLVETDATLPATEEATK